jgi:serine-type D-Ala-D-Ala endopeptidase (penicillin-binding protein 7)
MDKLLRKQHISSTSNTREVDAVDSPTSELENYADDEFSSNIDDVSSNYNNFANLGAPREREADEYVPNAILKSNKKPQTRMPMQHFKLVSDGGGLKEASNITFAKYALLALFIGISVTSFLTQGVLTIKDMVFNSSPTDTQLNSQMANQNNQNSNKVLGNVEDSQNEPLGSDDGASQGGSSMSTSGLDQNQYRLANEASFPRLSSRSYLAADLQTGEIILEQNENLIAPIASVTKLMTAVIAEENMDMQKIAIVSRDSYNTYGAQGKLLLGEKIKVYDLMYPLLMESSNDAAEVLADAYEKGNSAFMALMNKKAVELGMNDTYYEDPSGLNPKNVSSIHDLLKLGRYTYQKHPNLYSMTRVRQYAILKHTWFNQNRFLNYDTFLGGKNGYIDEAKKTTVSIFDVTMARGGKRPVVIVLLKSDDREGDAVKIINFLKKNAYYQEVPTAN